MTRGEFVSALWLRGIVCWLIGLFACGLAFAFDVGVGSPFAALLLGPFLGFGATWWMVPVLAALSACFPQAFARRPYLMACLIGTAGWALCEVTLGSVGRLFSLAFVASAIAYAVWSRADPLYRTDWNI